jgi:hypothetical protein
MGYTQIVQIKGFHKRIEYNQCCHYNTMPDTDYLQSKERFFLVQDSGSSSSILGSSTGLSLWLGKQMAMSVVEYVSEQVSVFIWNRRTEDKWSLTVLCRSSLQ